MQVIRGATQVIACVAPSLQMRERRLASATIKRSTYLSSATTSAPSTLPFDAVSMPPLVSYGMILPCTEKRVVWMVLTPVPPTLGPAMRKKFVLKGLPITV